jgi:hypothetical protein
MQVLLGVFAKLWKVAISFVMFVCPSTLDNLVAAGWIFMKIWRE